MIARETAPGATGPVVDLTSERPAFPPRAALGCLSQTSRLGLRRFLGKTLLTQPRRLGGIGLQLLLAIGGDLRRKSVRRVPAFLQYLGACRFCQILIKHGYSSPRLDVRRVL